VRGFFGDVSEISHIYLRDISEISQTYKVWDISGLSLLWLICGLSLAYPRIISGSSPGSYPGMCPGKAEPIRSFDKSKADRKIARI
jgi:hypothetical protein